MSSSEIAIRAQGLGKTYTIYSRPLDRLRQALARKGRRYGRDFVALGDISFDLMRGEVLGVVGNNGAGKSTLLQLICKTLQPTGGTLQVNGRIAALLELGAGFNPEFTGRENIFLNAAVLGLSTDEIASRFDSIVDFSGIGDFIEQPVKTYSSGMYVRLAFAIATSVEPDILVIDEALSVGDGAFARKSFDRIMTLRESGVTILFCSHSLYQIEAICDKVIWLERGQMLMNDIPPKVTAAYRARMSEESGEKAPDPTPVPIVQEAAPVAAPKGTARLLSLDFSVDGKSEKPFQARAGVSCFSVDATFQIDPALPPPNIAYALETTSGAPVSSGSTLFDGVRPAIDEHGVGKVHLDLPNLPLMRGKYRITMYLFCERVIHVYEQALHCAEIEVFHDGNEQGIVFIPHSWDGGPVVMVPAPDEK